MKKLKIKLDKISKSGPALLTLAAINFFMMVLLLVTVW